MIRMRNEDDQHNAMQSLKLSWVVSQFSDISWEIIPGLIQADHTKVIIYYSYFLTFTSTVDLLGQNLLLFVQLLELSRVQHLTVHLKNKINSASSSSPSHHYNGLPWGLPQQRHFPLLTSFLIGSPCHHYGSITTPCKLPGKLMNNELWAGCSGLLTSVLFCEVCTALTVARPIKDVKIAVNISN